MSPKCVSLWSDDEWVLHMRRLGVCTSSGPQRVVFPVRPLDRSVMPPAAVALTDIYTDSSGKQRFKGNRHLKASQEYPVKFGKQAGDNNNTLQV